MKKIVSLLINFLVLIILAIPTHAAEKSRGYIFLACTIGPIDAGIIDALEDAFEKDSGIRVRHVGAGTGEALNIAKKGEIDVVIVHARSLEEKFIAEGYGTERVDLMFNDFIIVGPQSDPAGIKGMDSALNALKKIAENQGLFVTRGDKSGTHIAEMELWTKTGVKPAGAWYVVYEKGNQGNVPTLRFANEKSAYTLIDRATYLTLKKEISLAILVEKDPPLINYISVIPVSPKKARNPNEPEVAAFTRWLTDPNKGQKIIQSFGVEKFGAPLFFPNSKEWRAINNK
jgi:tungstate transport system substrate-binding protein